MTPDPALTFAQEALGCREHAGYNTCIEHGGPTWPCPEAVRVAALIEARDAQIRADECEQAAEVLYAAIRTHPAVQDAVLAALVEGGRLVEEAANSPTVTPISFDRVSFMGGEDGCEAIVYAAGQTLTITRKVRLVEPEWREATP